MSKAQELVDYLNGRIAAVSYNQRQVPGNEVHFGMMQGKKYARIIIFDGRGQRSAYAFVDADGIIYKAASWKAPAKGARATVEAVVTGDVAFFRKPGNGFDLQAYSTYWLYVS